MKLDQKYIDDVIALGMLLADFAKVERATYLDKLGRRETDSDHTVMLAVLACAVAAKMHPEYDLGLVSQFALVHDLVEVHSGDVMTINFHKVDFKAKEKAEKEALIKLHDQFGESFPWLHQTIEAYENQDTPEARFVKTLDKALPAITHIITDNRVVDENFDTPEAFEHSVNSRDEDMLNSFAHDQEIAMEIRQRILSKVINNKRKRTAK